MNNEKTLRDEFAMAALTGLSVVNPIIGMADAYTVAEWAYKIADAMLKARAESND